MRSRLRLAPVLAILFLASADRVPSQEPPIPRRLDELPELPTEAMDPEVATQLEEARTAVVEASTRPEKPEELATAWGRLGELLFLYGVPERAGTALENALEAGTRNPRWEYLLAILDQEAGRLDPAVSRLERLARGNDSYLPARIRLGRIELARDRLDRAERWFREALDRHPGSAAALHGLGLVAQELRDWSEAVRRFRQVLEKQPSATSVHYPLGLAYRELGDRERALEHMTRRGDGEVRLPDPYLEAVSRLSVGVGPHMMAGNRAALRGDRRRAAESFRRATEVDPGNVRAWRALAAALAHGGELEEARAAYDRLLGLEPDSPSAHYNLARLLLDSNRPGQAEDHLRTAIRLAPDYADAHFNLAALLWKRDRRKEASEHASRAVELEPTDPGARLQHARFLLALDRRDTGIRELSRALELGLTGAERRRAARMRLARELGKAGRFEEAAFRYAEVLEEDPGQEEAHFGRAMALLLGGRERKARTALEEALSVLPDSLPLEHLLARLLATATSAEVRNGERALALAREVMGRRATLPHAETVAMALAELGRFQEAVAWQRRAVDQARRIGREDALPTLTRRLRLYEAGKPVRSPWNS